LDRLARAPTAARRAQQTATLPRG